ncbi:MAG: MASE1 domain-containing protein [Rhodobacteraceae bacterium]|jgi:PAS domain S-box-containing protein|nr:MASE1 domain-containing protein [Paracoccaceae bacterium]
MEKQADGTEASGSFWWSLSTGRPGLHWMLAALAAYLLAVSYTRLTMIGPDVSISIWPPNGVILAILLGTPRQSWPWWLALALAGELAANAVWFQNPVAAAAGYGLSNCAEILVAAYVLSPVLSRPQDGLRTMRDVFSFLAVAVVLAPLVAAAGIGAIDAVFFGRPFTLTAPMIWLGDGAGHLIAVPLVLSMMILWRHRGERPAPSTLAEGAVIAVFLAGVSAWQFADGLQSGYLLLLPVLWAALRFGFVGTSFATAGVATAIAIYASTLARNPSEDVSVYLHATLQARIMVTAVVGLIIAAIMHEQRTATAALKTAAAMLEQRVAERTLAIEAAEALFRATFKNAAVGMAILSEGGVLMRVNERLARMLGHSAEDLEGQTLDSFTDAGDIPRSTEAWERLARNEADEYEIEKRYMTASGETIWGHTAVSCVRRADGGIAYAIKVIQDITDRKRSDEIRQLLMHEVNHRSKNMLAMVQAIARQTAWTTSQNFLENFGRRMRALAANQDLLIRSGWEQVAMRDLVQSQLGHFVALLGSRILPDGPPVSLSPAAAQAIGMALHELGTNASKYGSLSTDTGRVEIGWAVEGESFRMWWRETGGPPVAAPSGQGFGSTVLTELVTATLSAEVSMDFAADGFVWSMRCPVAALRAEAAGEPAAGAPDPGVQHAAAGRG